MLFNPNDFFPDGVNVDKANLREAFTKIMVALGQLPGDSYAPFDSGEMLVLGDGNLGPAPASMGALPIKGAGRPVGHIRTEDIELGTGINLTDYLHLGRWLKKTNSQSCLITVEPHNDPQIGVLQGFKCVIWRRSGAGAVQVTSSMTNTHPSGHTRLLSNGIATLTVDTVLDEWSLHGETIA